MALFEYQAINSKGKQVAGIVDAESPKQARQKLRGMGVYPVSVEVGRSQVKRSKDLFSGSISAGDISIMTRQFATLIRAGLPIVESLGALVEQLENRRLRKVIAKINEEVKEGSSLADAMGRYPNVFSVIYCNLVMAGERSGTLDMMLERVADYQEKKVKQAGEVSSILLYPVIMLVLGLVIVSILVVAVVPKVVILFEGMEKTLPMPTIILIAISDFLRDRWLLLVTATGLVVLGVKKFAATEGGRAKLDDIILYIPVFGRIIKMMAVSRLTRTLSTLIASGVPLLEAMTIAKKVVNNLHMEHVLDTVIKNIREGDSIAAPLKKSGLFPPMLTHMIAIGEKSGALEDMLVKVADVYDNEVKTTTDKMIAALPPILTLFMGAIIFFIIMAILGPMFDMSGNIG